MQIGSLSLFFPFNSEKALAAAPVKKAAIEGKLFFVSEPGNVKAAESKCLLLYHYTEFTFILCTTL